ncbi:hypothetical protein [Undibacterium sp. TS12]|uniref:hypothetical protein n=1 Tax=Undibacterium sp. TS12 TaxID=2908202 RepID=UPI001F4CFB96|nr:hypothetical protein [Undibacterium sp. TS12]MCH8622635.1 hypothetical protein [Undibacterium sp. TS12]
MVRANNLNTIAYAPGLVPTDAADMQRFFSSELQKIASSMAAISLGHLDKTAVAPVKPRDGDIRYADGINWNPGSGVGVYYYKGATSAWVFLG